MKTSIDIPYITEKIEQQLQYIEKSQFQEFTDYQLGYIAALNFVLDSIIEYQCKEDEKPVITEGWKPFSKREGRFAFKRRK